jgi:NAD(P)H dehydrogenase (quinone)
MKKILIIKSHPKKNSFCHALADKYIEGTKQSKHTVKTLLLKDLNLGQFITEDHKTKTTLTPELQKAQELIRWADHLVFAYPTWWATPPALLKIFIEMVFEPGFAYKYHKSKGIIPKWDKLLAQKSARIIVTMDSPPLYHRLMAKNPGFHMMKDTLRFCGVKPVSKNYFGSVKMSSEKKRKKWLEKMYQVGLHE